MIEENLKTNNERIHLCKNKEKNELMGFKVLGNMQNLAKL